MLIICITAANLNPIPILYFIFYNLLYGLVFSLFIPLYCLYKETSCGHPFMPGSAPAQARVSGNNKGNGASVSGGMLAEAGLKKPGIQQWAVLSVFVAFSIGGQLIPKMAAGEQVPWHLLPMGIVPLIMTTFLRNFYSGDLCRAGLIGNLGGYRQFWFQVQCSPFTIWVIRDSAHGRIFFCCL